jgi:hypothetical protein
MLRVAFLALAAAAATGMATAATPDTAPASGGVPPRVKKAPPAVPPDKAAKPVASVPMVNPGFESTAPGRLGMPEGWLAVQHAGPLSYTFDPDATTRRGGAQSMRVRNVGPEPFGSMYQTLEAAPYRGKTLRFSAWMRTEGTLGNRFGTGAGLKLHSARGGYALDVAEMRRDAVHGTTDWTRYEIRLKVPQEAEQIEAGLVLFGPGTVWLDDVALDVVDDVPAAAPERPAAVRREQR